MRTLLVNYDRETVLFTPFKNYSVSIHTYFEVDRSWIMCLGPQPFDGLIGPHSNTPATWWNGWELWLPIRNPYDRVASMWKYQCHRDGFIDFDEWMRDCFRLPHFGPVTVLYRYTRLIHCENLQSELRLAGCDFGELPKLNASEMEDPHMTAAHRREIEEVHASDFHAGGY